MEQNTTPQRVVKVELHEQITTTLYRNKALTNEQMLKLALLVLDPHTQQTQDKAYRYGFAVCKVRGTPLVNAVETILNEEGITNTSINIIDKEGYHDTTLFVDNELCLDVAFRYDAEGVEVYAE